MPLIKNPQHSRPIDVHRWSDHPEVKQLVEEVWEDWLPEAFTEKEARGGARPGPKAKASDRQQLRVLILDLYVAWREDPELSIGVSMSPNAWKAGSRYNALHISKRIIELIKVLKEAALIDLANGSYAGAGAPTNRTTRIRASEQLQAMFHEAKFGSDDV
ncbi:hypothetical protein [Antarctobacter sp.]|uniref:hypothetical protein n=1 Tax=Antarctobacter sp. TaxID=1872577 RepID=UPI003A8CC28D